MAIVKMDERRSASCRFVTGMNPEGSETYMTRTIANFKVESLLDDVYEVAGMMASLYPYSIKNINMNERCELVEG
ncbi:hypothetical protein Amet_0861 [Alkaliphilus metalliredigens QYMF]|uniref:DUF1659 domain-containing protein n=1 Tax=Alkaliphilus metalliredigens (strain QYMF) TaxID=293826 RepID=A6TLL8_ALKMQ|nr:DUF1659 domain-containing protein [Alkaliphilus metalliredigens]ABR47086.1 hypothetical protein Amet_0861 [Alkaliphilus metalliredigens QYMF]